MKEGRNNKINNKINNKTNNMRHGMDGWEKRDVFICVKITKGSQRKQVCVCVCVFILQVTLNW